VIGSQKSARALKLISSRSRSGLDPAASRASSTGASKKISVVARVNA
jgi:hypothetical protein